MRHEIGSQPTKDGLRLQTRRWLPDEPPIAAILIVHGISEHSGRYARLASELMMHRIAIYSYDQRGHGRSEGTRVYVDSFDEFVADLSSVHSTVKEQTQDIPLFLYGHSLGGLVVAKYIVDHTPEVDGVIFSSPALKIPDDLSPFLQKMARLLSRLIPKARLEKLDIEQISRDKQVQEQYLSDPLIDNKGIRVRVGAEALRTTEVVQEHPEAFTMPLFLFHGSADKITDPDGSKWLYESAPSTDKTLELYQGYRHETINEIGREKIVEKIISWVLEHS